jgi:hypothetical protein
MKLNTDKWNKWRRCIKRIRDDLSDVVDDQAVFTEFWNIVQQNQNWIYSIKGDRIINFVWRSYATSAIMGIRRHLKRGDKSISLRILLDEIFENADQITYEFYLTVFPPKIKGPNSQKHNFKKLSEDGKIVSRCIVFDDITQAKNMKARIEGIKSIEEIADRKISHLDSRGTEQEVTDKELMEVIENFNKITCKYSIFLDGDGWETLEASSTGNWTEIFRHPLIEPKNMTLPQMPQKTSE